MDQITIELPIPMPTWNRILQMHPWERKKLRDYIHHAVSTSYTYGTDWPTVTEFQGKRLSTELFMLEYFQMIRPNKSRKQLIASKKPGKVRRKKRS